VSGVHTHGKYPRHIISVKGKVEAQWHPLMKEKQTPCLHLLKQDSFKLKDSQAKFKEAQATKLFRKFCPLSGLSLRIGLSASSDKKTYTWILNAAQSSLDYIYGS